ncbi:hypothetical protein MNBD_GAMMA21-1771 [hydrothermal vent metagenome]|uniref:Uncharacterized protein n=1 Tax=hydrothermal vent metagenome TaxID=652676 RepID=A0A3B0ZGF4_9ZZZZ
MRSIANRYLDEVKKPAHSIRQDLHNLKHHIITNRNTFALGLVSIALYTLLYFYSSDLTHIAEETNHGHKALFFVPIVIALLFSFVHGSFTSQFWDSIGVKAKKP